MNKYIVAVTLLLLHGLMNQKLFAETYTYDSLGRLTGVVYTDSSSITYSYDSNGNRLSREISTNSAPLAENDTATTAFETAVNIDVLTNDTDAEGTVDSASVTIVVNATNGTTNINVVTGTITYTPEAGFSGADSFTYTVNDDQGSTSNLATVSIIVDPEPANQAPVASNDSATTNFNTATVISVLGNDIDADGTIDIATVAIGTAPQNGTTSIATNGLVTYSPTTGFSGADSFTYTVMDNDGATSNIASVSVTVNAMQPIPPPSGSGGGSMGGSLLLLILSGFVRRYIPPGVLRN